MSDPAMPLAMRLMAVFGTRPEVSAANAVRLLNLASVRDANGAILCKPTRYSPQTLASPRADAEKLWNLTTQLAQRHGLELP